MEEVERKVNEAASLITRKDVLERVEARDAVREDDDDLAIEHGLPCGKDFHRAGDRRELSRPVLAVAAQEAGGAVFEPAEDSVAVEFHLVPPARGFRSLGDQGAELRLDEFRKLRFDRSGNLDALGHPRCFRCRRWPARGSIRAPDAVAPGRNLLETTPALDTFGLLVHDVELRLGSCELVPFLHEQPASAPVLRLFFFLQLHEHPRARELLAMEPELQEPRAVALVRVADRLPPAPVPEENRSAAVLPFRNDSLETAVLDRVILRLHREPLHRGVETRPLRDGPALQDPSQLEPEIVVKMRCRVLLDHEGTPGRLRDVPPPRLERDCEIPLATVLLQTHALRRSKGSAGRRGGPGDLQPAMSGRGIRS